MVNIIEVNKRDYEWKILKYMNTDPSRTFMSVESLELHDGERFRAELNYIDHFVSGDFEDCGIYYIDKSEID